MVFFPSPTSSQVLPASLIPQLHPPPPLNLKKLRYSIYKLQNFPLEHTYVGVWSQTCTYQSMQTILLTATTTLYSHVGISSPLGTTVCFASMVWASEWCHAHGVIHVTPLSSACFPRRHTSVIYPRWGMHVSGVCSLFFPQHLRMCLYQGFQLCRWGLPIKLLAHGVFISLG